MMYEEAPEYENRLVPLNDFCSGPETGLCPERNQLYQVIWYRHEMRKEASTSLSQKIRCI